MGEPGHREFDYPCLVLRGRADDGADAIMRQVVKAGAVVPSLWRLEVANALHSATRRKRIDAAFRDASLAYLRALPIAIDAETDRHAWGTGLSLAKRCELSLSDAAYFELAQRPRVPLASLDRELLTGCRGMRIPVRPL